MQGTPVLQRCRQDRTGAHHDRLGRHRNWLARQHVARQRACAIGCIGTGDSRAGITGFLVVQRAGMFRIMVRSAYKVTGAQKIEEMVGTAEEVDAAVRNLYRDWPRVLRASLWRLAALILQTGEVWLAATLLGFPIGIIEALMLKSLSSTLSDAAFVVPNSYGVQEGAFVVLGALVGLAPESALAISLAIRLREVLIDVQGSFYGSMRRGERF